ncbi:MAG: hypothetical protein ACT4RN_07780 [Pseudonocardia sp.]
MNKKQQATVIRAAEAVSTALRDAVQATVDERSPETARETVVAIAETGAGAPAPDGGNPAAMMTAYLLMHRLEQVRDALVDRPDRVEEILAWVEENLGRRYRLRARYTAAALEGPEGMEEVAVYAEALGADFMPSIIWLLAGAVARYGDGDADWLATLQAAEVS